ncbi:MAG: hypothetical protein AAF558_06580, partial [Verrucomicrobiota bacterium]
SEESLAKIKKDLTTHLAQKLTFSLFEAGRSDELKLHIRQICDEKLALDGIPLPTDKKDEMLDQIIAGMVIPENTGASPSTDSVITEHKAEELVKLIKPYLATVLTDDLFEPDRASDLANRIVEEIDIKIEKDALKVSDSMKKQVVETICSDMNIDPPKMEVAPEPVETPETPEASPEQPVPAVATEANETSTASTPPPPSADEVVTNPEEPVTAQIPEVKLRTDSEGATPASAPAKKPIPTKANSMLPLKALTHEIKRDLLYTMSTQIDMEVLKSGDELNMRTHIYELVHSYCQEKRFTLNDDDVEKIVQEILTGKGLEFQL